MTDRSKHTKLFVGNIPYEVTEQELRSILQGCGNIRFLNVRKDKQTNKSKGYAHIEYRHEWEAVEAFKRLIGKDIRGRVLKVDFCEDHMRQRYADLIIAANKAFNTGSTTTSTIDYARFAEPSHEGVQSFPPSQVPIVGFPPVAYAVTPTQIATLDEETNKRERNNQTPLIDARGHICDQELLNIVKEMNMSDVAKVVKVINDNMAKSPMGARCLLKDNRAMSMALIHAKMLMGNPKIENNRKIQPENEITVELEYFHSK